ncbi:MAG: hypothetical protein LBH92_07975, partial [Bacteroidales bacterium]|nr:hypothetical protein [Bacteroidales bacterium]
MIRVEELCLKLSQDESILRQLAASALHIDSKNIQSINWVKKAVDSRKKSDICFVYTVDVLVENETALLAKLFASKDPNIQKQLKYHRIRKVELFQYIIPKTRVPIPNHVIVVGTGPCGMFAAYALAKAGLSPLILERGKKVEDRIADVNVFFKDGILNPESNVQFGEGGAGTFSDGKLYTLVNDQRTHFIFQTLVACGAPKEILYDAKPHIGTDILRKVMVKMREEIVEMGGRFRFESKLTGLKIRNGLVKSAVINNMEELPVAKLILAIGHSARDTFEMLLDSGLFIQQKAFSVGVRIEHHAETINKAQYGNFFDHEKLPVAKYKLATHLKNGRGVYTFCMCPGGYVIAAASEPEGVVVNGMSEYLQNGENSNSAVLVNVHPSDFLSSHPLAGVEFQRTIEQKAFRLGGFSYTAPAQMLGKFLKNSSGSRFLSIKPTYRPHVTPANIHECFPQYITESLKAGIAEMDKKLRGFASPEAVLTAPETRSSSPIRILRDENYSSSIKNIFPAGEGAGYAG